MNSLYDNYLGCNCKLMDNSKGSDDIKKETNDPAEDLENIDKQLIDEVIEPEEIIDEKLDYQPLTEIFRENNFNGEATQFLPSDLIHLFISNIDDRKETQVRMVDNRGETRYIAKKTGKYLSFTTRLQQTRLRGDWGFSVKGPLLNDDDFDLIVPFYMVDEITEIIPVLEAEIFVMTQYKFRNEFVAIDSLKLAPYEEVVVIEKETGDLPDIIAEFDVFGPPTLVYGIGPKTMNLFIKGGYDTVFDIASSTPEDVAIKLDLTVKQVSKWVNRAQIEVFGKILELDAEIIEVDETISEDLLNVKDPDNPPSLIKGIGPVSENMLVHAGFLDVKSIADTKPKQLAEVVNITIKKAGTWIRNARALSEDTPSAAKAFDFTKIEGIGPTYHNRITNAGITSLDELTGKSIDELVIIFKTNINKAEKLLNNAKNHH